MEKTTPYDRSAKASFGRLVRKEKPLLWKLRYSIMRMIIWPLNKTFWNILNISGLVFFRKGLPEHEKSRYFERFVNKYGANILPDFSTGTFYDSQDWLTPVLEIGVADGQASAMFYLNRKITFGVEYVFGFLENGKKNGSFANIDNLVCSDIYSLPFKSNQFSTIILTGVMHHLDSTREYGLPELNRIMTPGGKILFSTLSDRFFHNRSMFSQLFAALKFSTLSKYFEELCKSNFRKKYIHTKGLAVERWEKILDRNGFKLCLAQTTFSPICSLFSYLQSISVLVVIFQLFSTMAL